MVFLITILLLIIFIFLYLCLCLALPPLAGRKRYRSSETVQLLNDSTRGAGERIRCIDNNEEALLWWLRVIAEAKDTLIMANHDLRVDNSGKDLMSALLDAAERGVRVKLLVDGICCRMKTKQDPWIRVVASHPGIEVRIYNQIKLFRLWKSNYRMHDKYIIADDRVYVLGGRNANDLFLGNYSSRQNIDRDILVYETVPENETSLKEVRAYFDKIWEHSCSRPFIVKQTGKSSLAEEEPAIRYRELQNRLDISPGRNWEKETRESQRISLLSNPFHNGNKEPVLWNTLCSRIEKGKHIRIQTPYLVCSKNMYKDLKDLVSKGAELQVITNSASGGSNYFGCVDYLNHKQKILETGITVYEYHGTNSLHSKALIIDNSICMVGSFNMDMRSAYLDTELMLLIESPYLAEHLVKETEKIMKDCCMVRKNDETGYSKETITAGKQCLFILLRLIDKPFDYLF